MASFGALRYGNRYCALIGPTSSALTTSARTSELALTTDGRYLICEGDGDFATVGLGEGHVTAQSLASPGPVPRIELA